MWSFPLSGPRTSPGRVACVHSTIPPEWPVYRGRPVYITLYVLVVIYFCRKTLYILVGFRSTATFYFLLKNVIYEGTYFNCVIKGGGYEIFQINKIANIGQNQSRLFQPYKALKIFLDNLFGREFFFTNVVMSHLHAREGLKSIQAIEKKPRTHLFITPPS